MHIPRSYSPHLEFLEDRCLLAGGILAVGADAGGAPQVQVFDEATHALKASFLAYLPAFTGGVRVAVGDVDENGIADIITAPGAGGASHIKVFSGVDFSLMTEFLAYDAGFRGGVYLAAGNLDADAAFEIVTGAGPGGGSHVRSFNIGPQGASQLPGPLGSFLAYDIAFTGGVTVAVGDVDDKVDGEIITGAATQGGAHVKAFRNDGTVVASFLAYAPEFFGGINVAAGDVDNDGRAEILTGPNRGGGPHFKAFDVKTGALKANFMADDPASRTGLRVGLADMNDDGRRELVATSGPGGAAVVRAFDAQTFAPLPAQPVLDPRFGGGTFVAAGSDRPDLKVLWFQWQPAEALARLSTTYHGARVEVTAVPVSAWHDTAFNDFAARAGADLVVLDSQWVGQAVAGGHVRDVTDFLNASGSRGDYNPTALSAYSEYPLGSGHFNAVPLMADTQMLVYRKDLFAQAGFQPPKTWTELLEQAKHFKESGLAQSGFVTHFCSGPNCYDEGATVFNQIAWNFGGEIWDPATRRIEGVLNSPRNIQALELAQELVKTGPANVANYGNDNVIQDLCSGAAAMGTTWFGFGPGLLNSSCADTSKLDFAVIPAQESHFTHLGGQGIGISSYTKDTRAALDYIAWLESASTQREWVRLGGVSARQSVLNSPEFLHAAPYNDEFAESFRLVKDFWNVPEFAQLLRAQMDGLNKAFTGQLGASEALDQIARTQQQILDQPRVLPLSAASSANVDS